MKQTGYLIFAGGVLLLIVAAVMMPRTAPYSDVLNIGLLQSQLMAFHAGLAACLAGALFIAAGSMSDALSQARSADGPIRTIAHDDAMLDQDVDQAEVAPQRAAETPEPPLGLKIMFFACLVIAIIGVAYTIAR